MGPILDVFKVIRFFEKAFQATMPGHEDILFKTSISDSNVPGVYSNATQRRLQEGEYLPAMQRLLMQSMEKERLETNPRLIVFANLNDPVQFGILYFTVDDNIIGDGLLKTFGLEVPYFHWNRERAMSPDVRVYAEETKFDCAAVMTKISKYVGVEPSGKKNAFKNKAKEVVEREYAKTATFFV
jgi:hypothetical protein